MEELMMPKVMLAIVCDENAADEVIACLRAREIPRFTMLRDAVGCGDTGRREGTAVWPGENAIVLSCVPESQVPLIVEDLRTIHDAAGRHTIPLKVFALPVQELL